MTMVQNYYTVDDFQQLLFDGDYKLPENVLSVIQYLEQNVVVPVDVPDTAPVVSNPRKYDNQNGRDGRLGRDDRSGRDGRLGRDDRSNRSSDRKKSTNDFDRKFGQSSTSWSDVRGPKDKVRDRNHNYDMDTSISFKPTKLVSKEGVEKQLNDIRVLLNKLSAKNYDTQKDTVINQILEILGDEPDQSSDEDEPANNNTRIRIATSVFDIACSNKFLSELYANLYAELVVQSKIFSDILVDVVSKYKATLYEIHYIDANVDYDGFCNYNKTNDTRKSMAAFIANLMVRGLIAPELVLNTIVEFQDLTFSYIDIDNKTNEVDEITENVVLLLTMCKPTLSEHSIWTTSIGPNIKKMVGMKAKEHKSLSSRVVFKYM